MQDHQTGRDVKVSTDGTAGPYVLIGLQQLDVVTQALNHHNVKYSVDRDAIRLDGQAATAVVNLGPDGDAASVQAILDDLEDESDRQITKLRTTATRALVESVFDKLVLQPHLFGIGLDFTSLFPNKRKERQKTLEERKTQLVKELTDAGIDPVIFDVLLSNEVDRRLKVQFGITFLVLTIIFTAASYTIVALNAVYKWGISEAAITALIIETPIQFVGLLYIIARNLFPNNTSEKPKQLTKP